MKFVFPQTPEAPDAITQLVRQFGGEKELLRAAVNASYFIKPEKVSYECHHPNFARQSRKLYPNHSRGDCVWADGVEITLDFNHRAQSTWKRVAGVFKRKSGYGVRHIWGHASDPKAYTATWNLCYMPFWAGMLTEEQHPHEKLSRIIQQISYDLYFRNGPVPAQHRPAFVADHGLVLESELPSETEIRLV